MITNQPITMSSEGTKTFTRAEVAKHNTNKDTWLLIHNNVYDVTAFLNEVRVCWRRRKCVHVGIRGTADISRSPTGVISIAHHSQ